MWVMHALRQDVVVLACLPFSRRLSARPTEREHPGAQIYEPLPIFEQVF